MTVDEFNTLVEIVSKVGIPLLVTAGVLFILWKIALMIPPAIKTHFENNEKFERDKREEDKARDDKFDKLLETIIAVAQESVEAQKRGNEIIERNNVVIERFMKSSDDLLNYTKSLEEGHKRIEDAISENTGVARKAYTEIVRISAKTDAM